MEKLKSDSIAELNLPNYIHNALIANGISSISQLIEQSETNELYETLSKFHTKDFDEIDRYLNNFGLKLHDKDAHLTRNKNIYDIGISDKGIIRYSNGIYRIGELIKLTKKELEGLPQVNKKLYKHIIEKVHESGLKFADEVEEPIEIGLKPLAILHLTLRPLNVLKRSGINNISMLTAHTIKELMDIHNMGEKSLNEIIEKVHSLGLKFTDEREEEKTSKQSDTKGPINDGISVSEPSDKPNEDKPQSQQFAADLEQAKKEIAELTRDIAALKQENEELKEQLQTILKHLLGIGDNSAIKNK